MDPRLVIALIVLAGFGLGFVFYGGLWLTVRAMQRSKHPAVLMLASYWTRTAVVLGGFLWTMDRRWQNAVACLAGFIAARFVCTRWMPQVPGGKGSG